MKVNFYLNYLSSSNNLHNFAHYSQMDEWLTTMDRQFNQVMPPPKPFSTKHNIDGDLVLRWAIELGSNAIHLVDKDMLTNDGLLTHTTCMWVQRALIASLVVGAHIPPCRLNLLKTWNHPHLVDMLKCTDEGCRMGKECLGNYLSIVPFSGGEEEGEGEEEEEEWPFFDYGAVSIKSVVVHGKTDRRGTGCALEYTLPRGDITKLLLAHITQGHAILTLEKDPPQSVSLCQMLEMHSMIQPLTTIGKTFSKSAPSPFKWECHTFPQAQLGGCSLKSTQVQGVWNPTCGMGLP